MADVRDAYGVTINHGQRPQKATSGFKPKSRASGGRRRDSGTRAAGTATLAHVPNYVAQHHAAPAAKIERHRTKEMVTEPLAEM